MTEPRKTPRTNVRTWKTSTGKSVVFASVAQALEIETQELAERNQELANALEVIGRHLRSCGLVGDADEIDELLARHRAKQEVGT